jgi:hypothetical protein
MSGDPNVSTTVLYIPSETHVYKGEMSYFCGVPPQDRSYRSPLIVRNYGKVYRSFSSDQNQQRTTHEHVCREDGEERREEGGGEEGVWGNDVPPHEKIDLHHAMIRGGRITQMTENASFNILEYTKVFQTQSNALETSLTQQIDEIVIPQLYQLFVKSAKYAIAHSETSAIIDLQLLEHAIEQANRKGRIGVALPHLDKQFTRATHLLSEKIKDDNPQLRFSVKIYQKSTSVIDPSLSITVMDLTWSFA